MKKIQLNTSLRARKLICTSPKQSSPQPLSLITTSLQIRNSKSLANNNPLDLSKSPKVFLPKKDHLKTRADLKPNRTVIKDLSRERSPQESVNKSQNPTLLSILALRPKISSPKTNFDIAKDLVQRKAFQKSFPVNELTPLDSPRIQRTQTVDSLNGSWMNFPSYMPSYTASNKIEGATTQLQNVENAVSPKAKGPDKQENEAQNQTQNVQNVSSPKAKGSGIRKKLAKKRATLRDLTTLEAKGNKNEKLNLYVEPTHSTFISTGDIVEGYMGRIQTGTEENQRKEVHYNRNIPFLTTADLYSPKKKKMLVKLVKKKVGDLSGIKQKVKNEDNEEKEETGHVSKQDTMTKTTNETGSLDRTVTWA